MQLSIEVPVNAPKHDVWTAITDIERSAERISGIEKVEVLEAPGDGLIGLKWRETRTMFGKTATETMWITDAVEDQFYTTEAQSHGSIYRSKMSIREKDGVTVLGMDFGAEPQTFGAKLMWAATGFMFKGATEKALRQDLDDIKASVEASG